LLLGTKKAHNIAEIKSIIISITISIGANLY